MQPLREYIEARSIPEPNSGCWLWLLSVGSHGYGNAVAPWARNRCRVEVAHRVAYVAFKGEIPDGMLVQHSCDNRICVNPDHLSLGTDRTNAADKHAKGRANLESRVMPPRPRPALIAAIRAIQEPHVVTGKRVGLSEKSIRLIRQRKTHRRVGDDVEPCLLPFLPAELDEINKLLAAA